MSKASMPALIICQFNVPANGIALTVQRSPCQRDLHSHLIESSRAS